MCRAERRGTLPFCPAATKKLLGPPLGSLYFALRNTPPDEIVFAWPFPAHRAKQLSPQKSNLIKKLGGGF